MALRTTVALLAAAGAAMATATTTTTSTTQTPANAERVVSAHAAKVAADAVTASVARAAAFLPPRMASVSAAAAAANTASNSGLTVHAPAAAPAYLVAAFDADGFDVTAAVTYNGQWGLTGTSRNGTVGTTGLHKTVYYAEGSGYEIGYLRGYLGANDTAVLTTTYLYHIVPSLLDPTADAWLQNSTFAPIYDALIVALADLLVADATASFNVSVAAGAIPGDLVDEMAGIADGAVAANASNPTRVPAIVTLNYGYDYLMALIYTGNIGRLLADKVAAAVADGDPAAIAAAAALAALPPTVPLVRPPLACDAFAATGNATAGGSIFARDFQFALALVFQDLQAPTIVVPNDGRAALVNVGAAAFVGAMTAMNEHGFAIGVDVMQAGVANITVPGLNSLLMVRAAGHAAASSVEAVEYVAAAQRGVPWFYPLSDASGDGRVIESGPTIFNGSILPDYRIFVTNATIAALLPTPAWLAANVEPFVDYRYGIFVRNMSGHMPLEAVVIPAYEPALFAAAGVPYPNASAWLQGGQVWPSWQVEGAAFPAIAFRYFSPDHLAPRNDVIAVSNLPLVPHMRIAGMCPWCALEAMGSPQWRYDSLSALVLSYARNSAITLSTAQYIISFLAPARLPGFNGPEVRGVIAVCDLAARVIAVKGGYWVDDFITITLPAYLPSAAAL